MGAGTDPKKAWGKNPLKKISISKMIIILVRILCGDFSVLYQQEDEHLQLIMPQKHVGLLQDICWNVHPSIA